MMSDRKYIEELTASIIREYLSGKEFNETFESFEKEKPRKSTSINSRTGLIKAINFERQSKKNKNSSSPFNSILELIICYILQKTSKKNLNQKNNDRNVCTSTPIKSSVCKEEAFKVDKFGSFPDQTQDTNHLSSENQFVNGQEPSYLDEMIGKETFDAAPKRRVHKVLDPKKLQTLTSQEDKKNSLPSVTSGSSSLEGNRTIQSPGNMSKRPTEKCSLPHKKTSAIKSDNYSKLGKKFNDLDLEDLDDMTISSTAKKLDSTMPVLKAAINKRNITSAEAQKLRLLLFGNISTTFNHEWMKQGFHFNSGQSDLNYGLVQFRGGPCGVLAVIQAYVIYYLNFHPKFKENKISQTISPKSALIHALSHILWKLRNQNKVILTLPSFNSRCAVGGTFKTDGLLETLNFHEFSNYSDLFSCIENNIHQFENEKSGCVLTLYSAIFSRGIENIMKDMDVPSNHLIGKYGYCSQEVVNLLLIGKASSNVFNRTIELDSGGDEKSILKGVFEQSEIGFLSLFEHYNSCKVGSLIKDPVYPIWVVCSESHFSVLFSRDRKFYEGHMSKFDLFYYDGLGQQDREIKLTVDTLTPPIFSSLTPPLDHCIRTKWKNSSVDWNGYDPIL